jgi:hypothetical protein
MTRTITIFFDTSNSDNLGYSAQLDIPGRPGVASEPGVSLTGARRCSPAAEPPAAAVRAARRDFNLQGVRITWARYDGPAEGWTGTFRTRA